MGKKETTKRHNFLWSLFGFRRNFYNIFRRQIGFIQHHFVLPKVELNRLNNGAGFTLVELLVVIGIIGILLTATLLILNPFAQIQKGNDTKRKGDLSQIQKALETYYHDLGKYPQSTADYKITDTAGQPVSWGGSFSPYMTVLPKDPSPGRNYVYFSTPANNPQSYYLYASLERDKSCTNGVCVPLDSQLCNKGNACLSLTSNGVSSSACGTTCNFGMSSSNVNP